jgi:rhamnosyltransferase
MGTLVTVAIPALDAGPAFQQTLRAINGQQVDREVELLVCDSGSSDGTVDLARRHGAVVIEIAPETFSHGATRNLLEERARGEHVAFLTQDAVPADERWLSSLLAGFALAPEVGLAFGPYRPRPDASPSVARELTEWFGSFSVGAEPRIDALGPAERSAPSSAFLGHRGYFTDANGCVARTAWQRVPFREISYAEDHLLAQDMLRAGFAKVYLPTAVVIHSHDYSAGQWLRRSFDEARAMREVYGSAAVPGPRASALNVWGRVGGDWRWWRARAPGASGRGGAPALLADSVVHHGARAAGALLGARADRLPRSLTRCLSLERRGR